jgi:myo-inositol-1(or 4)-monophosphatase
MTPHSHPQIETLTRFATDIVQKLGEEALTYYGRGKSTLKFDEELVTAAELHLSRCFQDELHSRYPEHILFKNNQDSAGYTHEGKRYLWIYDPIDGVDNFQTGIPIWGISLALLENYWPILGVFHMPATGDLFSARADHPAYHGKDTISVSKQKDINDESLLLTYSRFHQRYRSTFPGKIRDLGCTNAHICYVAMGRADAALIANESFTGLAAARTIIESAGGKISKLDGSGFFLNEYLDGQKIEDHLLVMAPENFLPIKSSIETII